ncbi:hypothetical protein ACB092_09G169500 [Castanea dentata]
MHLVLHFLLCNTLYYFSHFIPRDIVKELLKRSSLKGMVKIRLMECGYMLEAAAQQSAAERSDMGMRLP